jgi:hypothetical protein
MKATIILSTLVLFATLMGCSDNPTTLETQDMLYNNATGQQKAPGNDGSTELVWTMDQLSVEIRNETLAENKCVYANLPFTDIASYKIQFDVFTDANKFTNGYIPIVEVLKDEESVFQSSAFPNENGDLISHVGFRLTNTRFNELKFYVALMQGDNVPANNDDGVAKTLTISKIAVYRAY